MRTSRRARSRCAPGEPAANGSAAVRLRAGSRPRGGAPRRRRARAPARPSPPRPPSGECAQYPWPAMNPAASAQVWTGRWRARLAGLQRARDAARLPVPTVHGGHWPHDSRSKNAATETAIAQGTRRAADHEQQAAVPSPEPAARSASGLERDVRLGPGPAAARRARGKTSPSAVRWCRRPTRRSRAAAECPSGTSYTPGRRTCPQRDTSVDSTSAERDRIADGVAQPPQRLDVLHQRRPAAAAPPRRAAAAWAAARRAGPRAPPAPRSPRPPRTCLARAGPGPGRSGLPEARLALRPPRTRPSDR